MKDLEMKDRQFDIIIETFLPSTIIWFNITYILQTVKEGFDWHYVGGLKKKYVDRNESRLMEYLNVYDRQTAHNKIQWLNTSGFSTKKFTDLNERVKLKFDNLDLVGWNYCCILYVAAWCYLYSYFSFVEAMDISIVVAKKLQTLFNSWDDLLLNFLFGYEYCFNESPCDLSSDLFELYDIYYHLIKNKNGPLQLDWNTKLKQEW